MAGRKPVKEKVVPLTIYILPSKIESLGGRDQVREDIMLFLNGDLVKPSVYFKEEVLFTLKH